MYSEQFARSIAFSIGLISTASFAKAEGSRLSTIPQQVTIKQINGEGSTQVFVSSTPVDASGVWDFSSLSTQGENGKLIVAESKSVKLDENGHAMLSLKVGNPFDLGPSSGKIILSSSKQPSLITEIGFTITARRALWLIVIPVALGAMVGLGTRVWLQRSRDRLARLQQASNVVTQLRKAATLIADSAFNSRIEAATKTLIDAATEVSKRRFTIGNLNALTQACEDANGKLREAFMLWTSEASTYLDLLIEIPPTLSALGLTYLKSDVAAWKQLSITMEAATPPLLIDRIASLLSFYRLSLVPSVRASAIALVDRATVKLGESLSFARLRDLIDSDAAQLAKDLDSPRNHGDALRSRQLDQRKQWKLALSASDPVFQPDITAALDSDPPAWDVAVDRAALQTGASSKLPQEDELNARTNPRLPQLPSPAAGGLIGYFGAGDLGPIIGRADEGRRLELYDGRLATVQTLVFAIIYLLGMVTFYSEKWVGTWPEMFAIFAGAFAIDFSADGLKTTVTGLAKAVTSSWAFKPR